VLLLLGALLLLPLLLPLLGAAAGCWVLLGAAGCCWVLLLVGALLLLPLLLLLLGAAAAGCNSIFLVVGVAMLCVVCTILLDLLCWYAVL
jgi:hypothetical protein